MLVIEILELPSFPLIGRKEREAVGILHYQSERVVWLGLGSTQTILHKKGVFHNPRTMFF